VLQRLAREGVPLAAVPDLGHVPVGIEGPVEIGGAPQRRRGRDVEHGERPLPRLGGAVDLATVGPGEAEVDVGVGKTSPPATVAALADHLAGVLPASPLGTIGPEGQVTVAQLILRGTATALRVLSDRLQEAADRAEAEPLSQRQLENE
jgi:hypothetical protein